MVHGTEPYTDIIATPLAIRDPGLAPGFRSNLASTIDIAPTCLSLLGIDEPPSFPHSGVDLLRGGAALVYSQNFTANQPDNAETGIAKAFSVTDGTYTLLASARGLELYANQLDPGNHCNLLHFFALDATGRLALQAPPPTASAHFLAAWKINPQSAANLAKETQFARDDRADTKGAGTLLHPGMKMQDMERTLLEKTLAATGGNRSRAAVLLGISLRTVRNKIRAYGLPSRGAYGAD